MVNEFRSSFRYMPVFRTPKYFNFDTSTLFPSLPRPIYGGMPTVSIPGFTGFGDTVQGSGGKGYATQFIDNLTFVRGRHMWKAGYQADWVDHWSDFNPNPSRGGFNFANRYTGTAFGNSYADFLMGFPTSTTRPDTGIATRYRSWRHFFFIQDDWRISRSLTFNLGLRYEYQPVVHSMFDMIASFDPALGKILVFGDKYPPKTNAAMVAGLPIALAKDSGRPSNFTDYVGRDRNNLGPRIGFAWQPAGKQRFVVRGAYGIFYDTIRVSLFKDVALLSFNPPFLAIASFESDPRTPILTLSNPFPGSGTLPKNPSLGSISPGLLNPQVQQWNLTLEYELHGTAFRASYVGNRGKHLLGDEDLNAVRPMPAAVQPRRPYQPFADITWAANQFDSIAHQFQLGAKRRYGQGFSFELQYQFNRALGIEAIDDPFYRRYSRANLSFIRRHSLVSNYIWELPFGKGKRWLNGSPVERAVAGGWQVAGIATVFTGAPFSVGWTNSVAGCPGGRADIIGNPIPASRNTDFWFDAAAFRPATGCQYGNSAKNFLFGPNNFNWDSALMKTNRIREKGEVQFRAEFFNLPNHPQWGNPRTNISSPSPGKITGTSGERQVQFAMKVRW